MQTRNVLRMAGFCVLRFAHPQLSSYTLHKCKTASACAWRPSIATVPQVQHEYLQVEQNAQHQRTEKCTPLARFRMGKCRLQLRSASAGTLPLLSSVHIALAHRLMMRWSSQSHLNARRCAYKADRLQRRCRQQRRLQAQSAPSTWTQCPLTFVRSRVDPVVSAT